MVAELDQKRNWLHSWIKESFFITGSNPLVEQALLNGKGKAGIESHFSWNYTYVLYCLKEGSILIMKFSHSSAAITRGSLPSVRFVEHLASRKVWTFSDIAYLCCVYGSWGIDKEIFVPYSGTVKALEELLAETYGRIIYRAQAMKALQLFDECSDEEAERRVIGLRDGVLEHKDFAYRLKVQGDYSFLDLFYEYTFPARFYMPDSEIVNWLLERLLSFNQISHG